MEERVILVDKNDKEIGAGEKMDVHQKGLLHRAFSIFVFNSKKEVLLQKRASTKYHSPGLWSNTCCSHPRPGELLDTAVHRRLQEEMRFDCPLTEKFSFYYKAEFDNGLIEHEYDHVFVGVYEGEINSNPTEVESYKWCSWDALVNDLLQHPEAYTQWLRIIVERRRNGL